ncbi:hypothetical protein [Legionella micdadei]|uniref:Putative membrane protein n=1 Tax=Legionella micdadei TaxID=451 RepID=A0A098GK76_LEGMI|nr:hypothetical protein [Legionella micdadei]ARG98781.1 hypothetical protein B6N58_14585 [Legionella micdadei]KTD29006.1 coiled-coil protein [Legionella micdadei]CEG62390.1 putative membrane protein [Legionella micdadei]SCY01300.1 hypothetical protein SAMN02982997_00606 [Legionella micdadei]
MAFEEYYEEFADDKHQFFANVRSFADAEERAQTHHYGFLASNEKLIRKEYELLFERLKKDEINREIFWFYCYYCCIMLQNFHRAYGQDGKADEFLKLRLEIKKRLQKRGDTKPNEPTKLKKDKASEDSFFDYLGKTISKNLIELLTAPTKVSKIRDLVSTGNIYRIYWFFCRTSITKSFLLARDLELLDRLGSIFGRKIDADRIVDILETPNATLKVLSVGFFAFRFILNAAMLIKHTYGSKAERSDKDYDWWMRLKSELYKRHPVMINDVVWGSVNFITNYNSLVGIPDPVTGWIVVGFLFFDFCWFIYQRHLAQNEYRTKKSQLERDLAFYLRELQNEDLDDEKRKEYAQHCQLLKKQIDQLDIGWQALSSEFWFNSAAAMLLAVGFSASMIFTAPAMVIACYAICTFAVAMYLSAGAYKKYQEKSLQLEYANIHKSEITQEELAAATQAYVQARNEFIITMAKNVLMPTLFIVTYAICWEAALVLTAAYIGYQLYSAYTKHLEENAKGETVDSNIEMEDAPAESQSLLLGTGSSL